MKTIPHLLNSLIFVFLSGHLYAQQPACFTLGDEQFRGIQIYDIIQDKDLNYWFATNEGLYHFDHYSYERIECDQAKSISVFNFVINEQGTIYCNNLNNQIFQISARTCKLFYELESDEGRPVISLAIADNGNLVVGAKKAMVLDKNGKVVARYPKYNHYINSFTTKEKGILFHISSSDSVLLYSKGNFSVYKLRLSSPETAKPGFLKFFSMHDSDYALDLKSKVVYAFNRLNFTLTPLTKNKVFERTESIRIYETGNEIWVAGTLPGVVILDNKKIETGNTSWYEDYFISDVYKDREGNYLLGTFDKGVLVIPDMNVPDVINSFRDDPVTSLYAADDGSLFMGSSKGRLMSYANGTMKLISDKGKRPIEALYGSPGSELIFFDDEMIHAYNMQNGKIFTVLESSLKDVTFVSGDEYYLGTNTGIIKTSWNGKDKFSRQFIPDMNYRIYSLAYNQKPAELYASTANGLFVIHPDGKSKKITYLNEDLFPEKLYAHEGKIFALTRDKGVLLIENGRISRQIKIMVNTKPETLKKLVIYRNSIIASSSNGLYQFDMNGKMIKAFHQLFGFASKKVVNFSIQNNSLWVSHAGGVQRIDLNYRKPDAGRPLIRFDKILVNDELTDMNRIGDFKSKQRKVQFVFSSPDLKNRGSIRYHYQLIGYDQQWQINDYTSNHVTYNALAPGDYTLLLKAENQDLYSTPLSYSFSIAYPIYASWWFITAGVSLFLLLVSGAYRWQLNAQRKKSQQINELNASRLTAIQSQMNPHFIFNSLNSIQDLILKGDVEHSYSYITTFSDLVRSTLNHSEKDFIDFDQEIKLIELYLSLEKLRFKKDFTYSIDANTMDDFLIPPMLIQPFIENALVHGLLHKEGEKKLNISFELNELLTCTIEDNGVGREKARAIKLRQRSEHESFSGKAIRNRFEILSNVFKGSFGYTYEDLYHKGIPCGTRVTLSIPVKHEF